MMINRKLTILPVDSVRRNHISSKQEKGMQPIDTFHIRCSNRKGVRGLQPMGFNRSIPQQSSRRLTNSPGNINQTTQKGFRGGLTICEDTKKSSPVKQKNVAIPPPGRHARTQRLKEEFHSMVVKYKRKPLGSVYR